MNPAQASASGTKPTNLPSVVPGVSDENTEQASVNAGLKGLSKIKPKGQPQDQQQGIDPNQQTPPGDVNSAMANLESQLNQDTSKAPADASKYNMMASKEGLDPAARVQGAPEDVQHAALANIVEQGIPTAVSAIGGGAGAILGAEGTLGAGTGAGYEAGNAAAAALNVTLAPAYKHLADKIREHYGIPTEQKDAFDSRIQMAFQEALGMAIPRFMQQSGFAQDMVGKTLSKNASEVVAKNIETSQAARDAGIDLGPRGLMEGTQFESSTKNALQDVANGGRGVAAHDEQFLAQQKNLDAVTKSFEDLKSAVGTTTHENGTQVIKPENIEKRKEMIGTQIGSLNKLAFEHSEGKLFDPTPVISEFQDALRLRGIDTQDGLIPPTILNNLEPDAKAIATQYNKRLSKINEVYLENGASLPAEQLKYLRNRGTPTPNYNGAVDQKAGAQFQDVIPGQEMNLGAPMEVSGASNPIGAPTEVTNTPGVQGSLGLGEQADSLNKVIGQDASGKPITRAQAVAQASKLQLFSDGRNTYRGMNLQEIHSLTDDMQKLAEFDSFNRQMKQKQFGSISHTARDLRDSITKTVFDDAAMDATQSGNASLGRNLQNSSNRLENLNKLYGQHADAQDSFAKAVDSDSEKASELIMRSLGEADFNNLVSNVLTNKEKGALKSAYVDNLIKKSSDNGVIVDPKSIEKTLEKDGLRAKKLFGETDYNALKDLVGYAKTAEKIDSNVTAGEALTGKVLKTLNKMTGGWGTDFVENIFFRSPKIRDLIVNTPAYEAAFRKYNGSNTAGQIVSQSKVLLAPSAAANVASGVVAGSKSQSNDVKRIKEKNDELNMLDLEMGK